MTRKHFFISFCLLAAVFFSFDARATSCEGQFRPIGSTFRVAMNGSQVIDLGCGPPQISTMPRAIAQIFDAVSYVGVDARLPSERAERFNEFGKKGSHPFRSLFEKKDILKFLRSFQRERDKPIFFFIEGLEFYPEPASNWNVAAGYIRSIH